MEATYIVTCQFTPICASWLQHSIHILLITKKYIVSFLA